MILAADYPLLDVFWTMSLFFLWFIWIWLLVGVFADIFGRRDLSGWAKAGWTFGVIVLPYLGVFIYLITQHAGMTERGTRRQHQGVGLGGAAAEIAKAKELLDSGTIDQAEYESLKAKALA